MDSLLIVATSKRAGLFVQANLIHLTVADTVYNRHLISARTHPGVERRDNFIFDGTHNFIRVCHVVDVQSRICAKRRRCFVQHWRVVCNAGFCIETISPACRFSAAVNSAGSSFPRSFARRSIPRIAFRLK